jgi:hypothetical protein
MLSCWHQGSPAQYRGRIAKINPHTCVSTTPHARATIIDHRIEGSQQPAVDGRMVDESLDLSVLGATLQTLFPDLEIVQPIVVVETAGGVVFLVLENMRVSIVTEEAYDHEIRTI